MSADCGLLTNDMIYERKSIDNRLAATAVAEYSIPGQIERGTKPIKVPVYVKTIEGTVPCLFQTYCSALLKR